MAEPTSLLPSYNWQKEEDEEKKKRNQPIVVDTNIIARGKLEREIQRGQTLATPVQPVPTKEDYFSMSDAMHGVGQQLQDPAVAKDPAWWQKALGWLEPLKYLDIPIELAAEAIFDPLEAMAEGTQFSWARGSAERDNFEAWKALFGQDQGSFKERLDKAADAFEKRPLKMQLGLGAAQMVATFGTGAAVKGAAFAGASASKAGARSAIRGVGYLIDPMEGVIKGVGAGAKPGFNMLRKSRIGDPIPTGIYTREKGFETLEELEQTEFMRKTKEEGLKIRDMATLLSDSMFKSRLSEYVGNEHILGLDADSVGFALTEGAYSKSWRSKIKKHLQTRASFLMGEQDEYIDSGKFMTRTKEEGLIVHNLENPSRAAEVLPPFKEGDRIGSSGGVDLSLHHQQRFPEGIGGASGTGEEERAAHWFKDMTDRYEGSDNFRPRYDDNGNVIEGMGERKPYYATREEIDEAASIADPDKPYVATGRLRSHAEAHVIVDANQEPWKGAPWGLSPTLKRGNEFRRMFADIWETTKRWDDEALSAEQRADSLESLRDMTLMQLQLSMASRPGVLGRLTEEKLRQFVDTGILTVTEKVGQQGDIAFRNGTIRAMDEGEAIQLADLYLRRLDEFRSGKVGGLNTDIKSRVGTGYDSSADAVFNIDFREGIVNSTDSSTGSLNKRIADKYLGQGYGITSNAQTIRNQKLTEMWLEGRRFSEIMDTAGHMNPEITRGYIQDIDFPLNVTGQPGQRHHHVERLWHNASVLRDPTVAGRVGSKVDDRKRMIAALREQETEGGATGRRKGKGVADAEADRIIAEVGESYFADELLPDGSIGMPKHLSDYLGEHTKRQFDDMVAEADAIDAADVLPVAGDILKLKALKQFQLMQRQSYEILETKRLGIVSGGTGSASATTKGKLARAGFDIKNKKVILSEGGIDAKWAVETGLDEYLGLGDTAASRKKWSLWAQSLADEAETIKNFLDDNVKIKDSAGRKTELNLHDVLDEFIDAKTLEISNNWHNVTTKKNLARSGTGGETFLQYDIMIEELFNGSSRRGLLKSNAASRFGAGQFNKQRADFLKKIAGSEILAPMHVKGDWSTLQPDFVLNGETLTTEPIVYNFRDTSFEYHIPANPKTALEQELANAYQRQIVDKGEEAGKKAWAGQKASQEQIFSIYQQIQQEQASGARVWSSKVGEINKEWLDINKQVEDLWIRDLGAGANNRTLTQGAWKENDNLAARLESRYDDETTGYFDSLFGAGKTKEDYIENLRGQGISTETAEEIYELRRKQLDAIEDTARTRVGWIDMNTKQKDYSIRQWLNDEGIQKVLRLHGVNKEGDFDSFSSALKKIADSKPDVFGKNFQNWGYRKFGTSKQYALTEGSGSAMEMLEDIANRMSLNKAAWMVDYNPTRAVKESLADVDEVYKVMAKLRAGLPTEGLEDFMSIMPASAGAHQTIDNTMLRIGSSKLLQKLHEFDSGPMRFITNNIITPLVSAFAGGKAPIARPITKFISARAHLYAKAELNAGNFEIVIQKLATEHLGLKTLDATDSLKAIGVDHGNEVFSFLKSRIRHDNIARFENNMDVRAVYQRRYGKELGQPTYEALAKRTGEGDWAHIAKSEGADSLTDEYLTQVDVVMERILPEHWHEYFDLTDDQYKSLLWMKEFQNQVDQTARARGVDIVGRIDDYGGEYLENYFPRVWEDGNSPINLTARSSPRTTLKPDNQFFKSRTQKDVIHQLINAESATNMEAARRSVMQPMSKRLAKYYDTMMKEGIDEETKVAITNSDFFKKNVNDLDLFRKKNRAVRALEKLMYERMGKRGSAGVPEISAKWVEEIENSTSNIDFSEWKWLYTEDGDTVVRKMDNTTAEGQENIANLQKFIADIRAETGEGLDVFSREATAEGWSKHILENLSTADQRAMREQLEVASPWIMKPLEWLARGMYQPTQVFRTLKAGMDVGAPMIHGFNSLVRVPMLGKEGRVVSQKAWGKAVKEMKTFLWHPDNLDNYKVQNFDKYERYGPWVQLGHAEPLGGYQEGMFDRIGDFFNKNLPGSSGEKISLMKRFEAGFTGYTDVLRVELCKSFEPSIKRQLMKTDPSFTDEMIEGVLRGDVPATGKAKKIVEAYHEMGAVVNKMTGAFDQDLAQMTPLQRLMESSLIFFAPMYRRATFGIMADVFRGGMRSREALNQLSGIVGVGAMMGVMAEMTGNNERGFLFDEDGKPDLTARFGKFNVGGAQIGIGTAWWTVFRTASDIAMTQYRDDREIETGLFDNPYIELMGRRGRSQIAPGAGFLLDIVQGRTFVGDPLRDEDGSQDWSAIAKHAGRNALPFWLDGAGQLASNPKGAGAMMISEAMGFQGYEISDYDQLSVARQDAVESWEDPEISLWRRQQRAKGEEVNWVSMPKLLQDKITDEHDIVRLAHGRYEETYGKIAEGNAKLFREYREIKSNLDNRARILLANASTSFEKGEIDGRELNRQLNAAKAVRREGNIALLESDKYMPLTDWFLDLREGTSKKDMEFQGDVLYDYWQSEVMHNEANYNEEQEFNYENFKRLEAQFKTKYNVDSDMYAYLKERQRQWLGDNPVLREFESAKESLMDYWKIYDTVWKPGTRKNWEVRRFLEQPRSRQNDLVRANPDKWGPIKKQLAEAKEKFRVQHPEMDWLLVKWYGNVPRTSYASNMQKSYLNSQSKKRMYELETQQHPWSTPKASWLETSPSGRVTVNPARDERILTGF